MKPDDIYKLAGKEFTFLINSGFKPYKKESLIKETTYGFNSVSILVSDYKTELIVEFILGIRINFLEDIMNKFRKINPTLQNYTKSVMATQSKILNIDEKEYKIYSDIDLLTMADSFKEFMEKYGFPFYEKFHNLNNIDKEINIAPDKPCLLFTDKCIRAMYGILISKAINSPRYPSLVEIYRGLLSDWNEFDKARFEDLVSFTNTLNDKN